MSLSASSVTGGTHGTLTDTLCNATLWLFSALSVSNSQCAADKMRVVQTFRLLTVQCVIP